MERRAPLYSVHDQDLFGRLENLEGIRHVVGARHARPIALQFAIARVEPARIGGHFHHHPVLEVLFLLRSRPRLVGNLIALDDALSAAAGAPGAQERGMGTRLCRMRQDVPIRRRERFPHAAQIGLAVRRARRLVRRKKRSRRGLARYRGCRQPERGACDRDGHQHACEPNLHHPCPTLRLAAESASKWGDTPPDERPRAARTLAEKFLVVKKTGPLPRRELTEVIWGK